MLAHYDDNSNGVFLPNGSTQKLARKLKQKQEVTQELLREQNGDHQRSEQRSKRSHLVDDGSFAPLLSSARTVPIASTRLLIEQKSIIGVDVAYTVTTNKASQSPATITALLMDDTALSVMQTSLSIRYPQAIIDLPRFLVLRGTYEPSAAHTPAPSGPSAAPTDPSLTAAAAKESTTNASSSTVAVASVVGVLTGLALLYGGARYRLLRIEKEASKKYDPGSLCRKTGRTTRLDVDGMSVSGLRMPLGGWKKSLRGSLKGSMRSSRGCKVLSDDGRYGEEGRGEEKDAGDEVDRELDGAVRCKPKWARGRRSIDSTAPCSNAASNPSTRPSSRPCGLGIVPTGDGEEFEGAREESNSGGSSGSKSLCDEEKIRFFLNKRWKPSVRRYTKRAVGAHPAPAVHPLDDDDDDDRATYFDSGSDDGEDDGDEYDVGCGVWSDCDSDPSNESEGDSDIESMASSFPTASYRSPKMGSGKGKGSNNLLPVDPLELQRYDHSLLYFYFTSPP
jgi:hypothetical protein